MKTMTGKNVPHFDFHLGCGANLQGLGEIWNLDHFYLSTSADSSRLGSSYSVSEDRYWQGKIPFDFL